MSRINKIILLAIVLLAGLLRFYQLAGTPAGFTPDEAAFGYNAYSLYKTGLDEWSTPFWQLPFSNLRSFGDYKLPLYAFLNVPFVAVLGLNEFSTRLPNALLGTLSVAVIYILFRRLYSRKAYISGAFFASALLVVSPWHLPLSRGAFEANMITFFVPLGITLWLSSRYYRALLVFGLSLFTYHSPKIITPLVMFALLLMFRPKVNIINRKSLLIFLLLFIPAVYSFFFAGARASDVSILNPGDNWAAMADKRLDLISGGTSPVIARLVSNKVTFIAQAFIRNFAAYLSPKFLFMQGPGEPTYGMIPGFGVINVYQFPFIIIFFSMFFAGRHRKTNLFVVFLLLDSFLPAALTRGAGFSANRAAFMVIPLVLATASGLSLVVHFSRLKGLALLTGLLILGMGFFYWEFYWSRSPSVSPKAMGYGMKEAVEVIASVKDAYPRVKFSRSLSEPHIYYAFYSKTDPRVYQAASKNWLVFEKLGFRFLDQYDGYWLGEYRFGDLNFLEASASANVYVGRPDDFPADIKSAKTIYYPYPDYSPAVYMAIRK